MAKKKKTDTEEFSLRDKIAAAAKGGFRKGTDPVFEAKTVSTGLIALDIALGGGWKEGGLAEILGPSRAGKSYLLNTSLATNLKRGGLSYLYTSEADYNPDLWVVQGGDPEDLDIQITDSVEDFFESVFSISDFMEKNDVKESVMVGWDSLAMTGTKHLHKEGVDGKRDFSKAATISEAIKLGGTKFLRSKLTLLAVNQEREKIGDPYSSEPHSPGGKAFEYACSQRVHLRFAGGPKGSRVEEEEESVGRWIRATVLKNRFAEQYRVVEFPIYNQSGFPHPTFEGEKTRCGIDHREALLHFLLNSPYAHFGGEEKKRFLTMRGAGWVHAAQELIDKAKAEGATIPEKFRKKEWPQVISEYPKMGTYEFLTAGM